MKRLTALSVPLLTLAIAGCGDESDQLPVDGRDFDGVNYSEPAPYQGRVIDGYLKNARVWLDVNGDGKYTSGTFTIELDNGNPAVIEGGEPMAMSGQDGAFSLDLAALQLAPEVGRALDPRRYPLFAAAIPGTTVEQTEVGDQAIEVGYVLSANPGARNVTPLTTLARHQSALGLMAGSDLGDSLAGINVTADYIRGQDDRAHAYARALVKFMTQQIANSMPGAADGELNLSPEEARLLGISLLRHAPVVIAAVDEVAGAGLDYARALANMPEVPSVTVSITDPLVLTGQRILSQVESGDLPAAPDNLAASTELIFEYAEDGRLSRVAANGCLAPSMPELARLIGVDGYLGELSTQWLPSVSLSAAGWGAFDPENDPDGVVDETLTFDWDARTVEFQTSTLCHTARGIEPASTELGAGAEVTYSWSGQDGEISELEAQVSGVGSEAGSVYTLTQDGSANGELFVDYSLAKNDELLEAMERQREVVACDPVDDETNQENFVVTEIRSYLFSGYAPQPTTFTNLALEYDTRILPDEDDGVEVNRLLRYAFLDPALADSGSVTAEAGFQWLLQYEATPDANNPNLIREAYLSDYSVATECGKARTTPARAYAKVEYSYRKLSEYLLDAISQ